tara:strand:+ start:10704 stop:11807 length:1104 start_codon:yes stop_codon:yes gene_type:complete
MNKLINEISKSLIWKVLALISTFLLVFSLNIQFEGVVEINKLVGIILILKTLDFGIIYYRRNLQDYDIFFKQIFLYWILYVSIVIYPLITFRFYSFFESLGIAVYGLMFQEMSLFFNKQQKSYLSNIPFQLSLILSLALTFFVGYSLTLIILLFLSIQFIYGFFLFKIPISGNINLLKSYNSSSFLYFLISLVYIGYSEFPALGLDHFSINEYSNTNIFSRINAGIFGVFLILPNAVWNNNYNSKNKLDKYILNIRYIFLFFILFFLFVMVTFYLLILFLKINNTSLLVYSSITCVLGCINLYLINYCYRFSKTSIVLVLTIFEFLVLLIFTKQINLSDDFFMLTTIISVIKFLLIYTYITYNKKLS